MKTLPLFLFVLLLASPSMAFDPVRPPPKKTMEWTTTHISGVVIPLVDFDDTTIVQHGIDFLRLLNGAPKEYRVEIDGSALSEDKLHTKLPLGQIKNMKMAEMLGKVADAVDANLVIEPGIIRLVPRAPAAPNAAPNPPVSPPQEDSKPPAPGSTAPAKVESQEKSPTR